MKDSPHEWQRDLFFRSILTSWWRDTMIWSVTFPGVDRDIEQRAERFL